MASVAVAGVILAARPGFAQRPGGVNVVRGIFHPPATAKFIAPKNFGQPARGGKFTQAFLHLPPRYSINLPSGNHLGTKSLYKSSPLSKGSSLLMQVRPIQASLGHLQSGRPVLRPWPLLRPITSGRQPVDPNRYQGPPQWQLAPGSMMNSEPGLIAETPGWELPPQEPPPEPPDAAPGPDWPNIEDQPLDGGQVSDQTLGVNQETAPTRQWPTDEQSAEPARATQLDDQLAAAIEPEREWPSVDDSRDDQVALPEERLPNQKLDTDEWMTPEKPGGTDVNSLPDFGFPGTGLPNSEDIENWGSIPGLEDDDPLADPTNPFGKGGTGRPGGPDFGPDGGGPDVGGRQGILNLGTFDPHLPKDDPTTGGAKDPFGGPGPINTNKGPAGAGHIGNECFDNPSNIRFRIDTNGTFWVQQFYRNNPCGTTFIEYPDSKKKWDSAKIYSAAFVRKDGSIVVVLDPNGNTIIQPLVKPDRFRTDNVAEQAWKFLGFCEGPIDTGGDRPGPTSTDDLDKSKAAGVLVKDPAYPQGGAGGSGINSTNHPSHVSNPGYEGGSAKGGGIKSNKELVTDPPEASGK